MKNKEGLKCYICDIKTGIKIFNYKGYIEYFRKRKIAKAIDRINKISGLNYNYGVCPHIAPVANMILHDFLEDTIESADAIVKSKSEIMEETPALVYSIDFSLKLLVEKNILSKSTLDNDGEWYALNEKYFNKKYLKEFIK